MTHGPNKGDTVGQHARHYQRNKETYKAKSLHTKARRLAAQVRPVPTHCECCGEAAELQFDHDHACCQYGCLRCFRGWLCAPCNKALGMARDDLGRLRAMVTYIEESKCLLTA